MDPIATLNRWRAAIRDFDYEEAGYAAEDLRSWVRVGGFMPAEARLTPLERDMLGLTRKRAKRVMPRMRNCKTPNPRRCRGVGGEKRRVLKCVGKRVRPLEPAAKKAKRPKKRKAANPENPRTHFPKTARGRPPVNRGWSMQLFAAGEKHLQTKRLKVGKDEAFKLARGMVGKRVAGARVAKVILDGPK